MASSKTQSAARAHKAPDYALTESQVETLASQRTRNLLDCDQADGMYLRALIHHTQGRFGAFHGKRPATESQLEALALVAQPLYEAVLRGVTTPDIAIEGGIEHGELTRRTRERNRRATFARSAKATLVAWCNAGGDIRKLDAATVTKTELRKSVMASRDPSAGVERTIERAERRIIASITAQARGSPDAARGALEAVIEHLQAALDELPEGDQHDDVAHVRTRVGVPKFRGQARVLNRPAGPGV
jgi:hypothetical protein